MNRGRVTAKWSWANVLKLVSKPPVVGEYGICVVVVSSGDGSLEGSCSG